MFEAAALAQVLRNVSAESVLGEVEVRQSSEAREARKNLARDEAFRENDRSNSAAIAGNSMPFTWVDGELVPFRVSSLVYGIVFLQEFLKLQKNLSAFFQRISIDNSPCCKRKIKYI